MTFFWKPLHAAIRSCLPWCLAGPCALALAQTSPAPPAAAAAPAQTVVVTGNPLRRDDTQQPSTVLSGDALVLRRASTLGETLQEQPGVSASSFGPNASRPVIRGLDGDRVRLLDNGGASVDASSLSFDHASAIDPLVVERLEVLRGPAALLYGGSAVGGVVNAIDNRIPRVQPGRSLGGRAEVRLGGAEGQRSAGAVIEGSQGGLAWHADGFSRTTGDLRVPLFTPVDADGPLAPATRVRNSASQASGGAVGAAWHGAQGWWGGSAETQRRDYGVTVEPDVAIRMRRERLALAGEWAIAAGGQLSMEASHTRYRHEEVEGDGAVGTVFASGGDEARVQWRHPRWLGLDGVWGAQFSRLDFSAQGEEAFVPSTRTRSAALFTLQEWRSGSWTASGGLRGERVSVASKGDAADAEGARFGAAQQRRFQPFSASGSLGWQATPNWRLQATLGSTQRAPAYYELYADGLHVATAAYEVGDPSLALERSRHGELGLAWSSGSSSLRAQLWRTQFANYIALQATGVQRTRVAEGGSLESAPEYAFRAVRARLTGWEIEARQALDQGPWRWDLQGHLDSVRGDDLDARQPLPRLAPLRVSLRAEAARGAWTIGAGWVRQAAQDRVPATDSAVAGSQRLNLWLMWKRRSQAATWSAYARLDNLGNTLSYSATSVPTIRGLAPQGGRALSVGLRAEF